MRHSEAKIYIHIYLVELKTTSQVAPMVKNLLVNTGNARDVGSIPG